MHGRRRLNYALVLVVWLGGIHLAKAQTQALQRLPVGPFRIYYTGNSPNSVMVNGKQLIGGIYFYTAVEPPSGTLIEGFNFSRNEDGQLRFTREELADGPRLVWQNSRRVRDPKTRQAGALAGAATVTLTATQGGELTIRYQADIKPNPGFGEIGFYLNEDVLTDGGAADLEVTFPESPVATARLPLPRQEKSPGYTAFSRLTATSTVLDVALEFSGREFCMLQFTPDVYVLGIDDIFNGVCVSARREL